MRAAAFALAAYPAAIEGRLPIGAEAIADLGRLAGQLLSVKGELKWQERLDDSNTSHPELTRLAAVLEQIEPGKRRERARQLFCWALLNNVAIESPAKLEQEFDRAVVYLGGGVA